MRIARSISAAVLAASLFGAVAMPVLANNGGSSVEYSSYSIEQLEALIAKLQARLAELKTGSKCFISNADLSIGDGEGGDMTEDVRRLQTFLVEKGFLKYKPTGYFGKMTRASMVAFQAQQGIAQSGAFDAASREKAHAMFCKGATLKKAEKHEDKKKEEKKEDKKDVPTSSTRSINLTSSGNKVSWTVDGTAPQGFKVTWSKNAAPTYPPRDGDMAVYYSDPSASSAEIHAFSGAGTYYVRICEYIGGRCGTHSNQIEVQL